MMGNDEFDDFEDEKLSDSVQPLSSMDFSTDHELGLSMGSGSGRRIDRNAMVLALIVVASIVGLWSMRTLSRTSADTSVTEMMPEQVNLDPIDDRIIHSLVVQSPSISEIGGNRDPFAEWQPAGITDEAALKNEFTADGSIDRDKLCSVWQQEVERIAGLLKLKSVLGGGTIRALVNIEGVLLAIGETFDISETQIAFSVESTGRRSVRLGSYKHRARLLA